MKLVSRHRRPSDPEWEVAASTPVLVADAATVERLAAQTETLEHEDEVEAVLVAVRHPTGWFVHAVRRGDLADATLVALRELVTVRTYLLLTRGPEAPAWIPVPGLQEWRSVALSLGHDLDALHDALVD